jgi:hypothetical protein
LALASGLLEVEGRQLSSSAVAAAVAFVVVVGYSSLVEQVYSELLS